MNILDLGCGNGRLLKLLGSWNVSYTGMDNSAKLLEKAQLQEVSRNSKHVTFVKGDMTQLPFDDATFDIVFPLASFQHIPKVLQKASLKEMRRVLKKDGLLCMTNWAVYAQKNNLLYQIKKRLLHPALFFRVSFRDTFIPWKRNKDNVRYERYYYAFSLSELESLLRKTGFTILKHEYTYTKKGKKRNMISICKASGFAISKKRNSMLE